MPNTRLTVYNFIWHLIDTSTAYFIEKKCSSYQSNLNNEWTIDYITGFVKLRGNSNSLDRWLAIPQHTGEKTINITVNHAYWSWKHYMTVYFLAYLFGNRQIYEHRRTHGSFSWLQRDSKRGFYNFRRILISGVFGLQFSVICMLYKLWMCFLSKPMHVYLLLISLAKILPIYKSIRTEISPEFYQFPFVTSNITYRYGIVRVKW